MADFCTTASELRTGLWSSGAGDGPLRERFQNQLDTAAQKVATTLDRLPSLSDSPVGGGDAAVAQFGDALGELHESLVRGRAALDALPENATEDQNATVVAQVWPRVAARAADPFTGVTVSAAMRTAADTSACAPFSF
ncbi:hypothetical protein BLA60_08105 [Actinophytocola xinjiangensis]|uniref:Uncharacterized protein n=1 Tax=Actinophytocola xinjiangensis TaxID=485602 RepID=A0A7Z0WNV0_9PSEU|nr:hypothetical protein BLA60_08105 [Actinophytocola xinjiangensis]